MLPNDNAKSASIGLKGLTAANHAHTSDQEEGIKITVLRQTDGEPSDMDLDIESQRGVHTVSQGPHLFMALLLILITDDEEDFARRCSSEMIYFYPHKKRHQKPIQSLPWPIRTSQISIDDE